MASRPSQHRLLHGSARCGGAQGLEPVPALRTGVGATVRPAGRNVSQLPGRGRRACAPGTADSDAGPDNHGAWSASLEPSTETTITQPPRARPACLQHARPGNGKRLLETLQGNCKTELCGTEGQVGPHMLD